MTKENDDILEDKIKKDSDKGNLIGQDFGTSLLDSESQIKDKKVDDDEKYRQIRNAKPKGHGTETTLKWDD